MNWEQQLLQATQILLAAMLGGLVGWQRERDGYEAGVRTYAAVALGACLFGLVSAQVGGAKYPHIAAQVVSGIGFLGAGVILKERGKVHGLTTAATIWATASLGLAVASGLYLLALLGSFLLFGLLWLSYLPAYQKLATGREEGNEKDQPQGGNPS